MPRSRRRPADSAADLSQLAKLQAEVDELRAAPAIRLDYPVYPRTREWRDTPGGRQLSGLLAKATVDISNDLESFLASCDAFAEVAVELEGVHPARPAWNNGFLPPLDAIALVGFLATRRPARYLEVGSGNSTMFARLAIEHFGLATKIISIDPYPRAGIDEICDDVRRIGLEDDGARDAFAELEPGDLVFFDGSHRALQNSDVVVFFNELLPGLPHRCVYGVHDIWLPYDYPVEWHDRYYSEQYMLATWLLAGAGGHCIRLPAFHVSTDAHFRPIVNELLDTTGARAASDHHGCAFWLETKVDG